MYFTSAFRWYRIACFLLIPVLVTAAQNAPTASLAEQLKPIQSQPEASDPRLLTNEKVTKMTSAKLGDAVIVGTIKKSQCNFDTSPDALIKLKQAGVSDAVLQAMIEAGAQSNSVMENEPPNSTLPRCGEYESCMSSGAKALRSARWNDAIAAFQEASTLQPSKPDAWAGMGNAYLAADRKDEASEMWDKALSLGGPLTFVVCRPQSGVCQSDRSNRGELLLSPSLVSFIPSSGQKPLTVSPSDVNSAEVSNRRRPLTRNELHLKIKGKNYDFYLVPFGIDCGKEETAYCEEDEAVAQQLAVFSYVSQAIPKLAAGSLGKPK